MILAAPLTTWEKLQRVPNQAWLNLVICVVAVVLVVRMWRALKKFNDYAPYIVAMIAASGIMAFWVYERTEPAILTPVVERLTNFLPTKAKHERDLDRLRKSREADR